MMGLLRSQAWRPLTSLMAPTTQATGKATDPPFPALPLAGDFGICLSHHLGAELPACPLQDVPKVTPGEEPEIVARLLLSFVLSTLPQKQTSCLIFGVQEILLRTLPVALNLHCLSRKPQVPWEQTAAKSKASPSAQSPQHNLMASQLLKQLTEIQRHTSNPSPDARPAMRCDGQHAELCRSHPWLPCLPGRICSISG